MAKVESVAALFFQFEPAKDGGGIEVDVRCKKHLPKGARIVKTEEDRRRTVGGWLETTEYHSESKCFRCHGKPGARIMKDAILITKDARQVHVTLDTATEPLGVICQQDTRLSPPFRTFSYRRQVQGVPVFEEVEHAFLNAKDHLQ